MVTPLLNLFFLIVGGDNHSSLPSVLQTPLLGVANHRCSHQVLPSEAKLGFTRGLPGSLLLGQKPEKHSS